MFLTKVDILKLINEGKLIIKPIFEDTIVEDGIDLRVGTEYAKIITQNEIIDLSEINDDEISKHFKIFNVDLNTPIIIAPNDFILLTTFEYVKLPSNVVGICNLRSTIARWGLKISTSLIVSPGFEGNLIIEVVNHSKNFVKLRPGLKIVSLKLFKVETPFEYVGKYKGQKGVQLPKSLKEEYRNFIKSIRNYIS